DRGVEVGQAVLGLELAHLEPTPEGQRLYVGRERLEHLAVAGEGAVGVAGLLQLLAIRDAARGRGGGEVGETAGRPPPAGGLGDEDAGQHRHQDDGGEGGDTPTTRRRPHPSGARVGLRYGDIAGARVERSQDGSSAGGVVGLEGAVVVVVDVAGDTLAL